MLRFVYLTFLSFLFFNTAVANSDTIPEPIWNNRTDYKAAEKLVVKYIRDIEKNPINDLNKRYKSDYVLRWILGCPNVAIKMSNDYFEKILTDERYSFADYTAYGLLFGEVLYNLENPYDRDKTNALRSGVYYTMDMYKKLKVYKGGTTCEILELFIRLDRDKVLNKFIFLDS